MLLAQVTFSLEYTLARISPLFYGTFGLSLPIERSPRYEAYRTMYATLYSSMPYILVSLTGFDRGDLEACQPIDYLSARRTTRSLDIPVLGVEVSSHSLITQYIATAR